MTAAQKHTSTHPAVAPDRRTNAHAKGKSLTTPKHYARSGVGPYTFCNRLTADQVYDQLSRDMKDAFSGSMPYKLYLKTFHPVESSRPPLPKLVFKVPLRSEEKADGKGYYQGMDTVTDVVRISTLSFSIVVLM